MSPIAFRRLIGAWLLLALLGGCTTTLGERPRYEALASLTRGESTEADVRRLLGEPFGQGQMRTGKVTEQREVWSYEHAVVHSSSTELGILLVLFDHGRYDGHLWFSSASLLEVER